MAKKNTQEVRFSVDESSKAPTSTNSNAAKTIVQQAATPTPPQPPTSQP